MTIVIPKPDIVDRLLRLLGKKRGVTLRGEATHPNSIQFYYTPKKESSLTALLRPSGRALPDGMIDVFTLQPEDGQANTRNRSKIRTTFSRSGPISQQWPFSV